jgi:guanylate kinase
MTSPFPLRPLLIVVSAPSGAGKTTLCRRLLADRGDMVYSVSCTTRPPRGHEVDGRAYFFLSEEEFDRKLAAGELMEHAAVHGFRYGTPRQPVLKAMTGGQSVLMDIDVQGAAQMRTYVGGLPAGDPLREGFLDIFIEPPSMAALRARLEDRGEDRPEVIARRLRNAEAEMSRRHEFRYRVVNDELDAAYGRLAAIIHAAQRGAPIRRIPDDVCDG